MQDQLKRQNGVYYTTLFNPFLNKGFLNWVRRHNLTKDTILEPFAGSNSIIDMLQSIGMGKKHKSYDITPQSSQVKQRDTISNYPQGYRLCITNPPWLYKSAAKRRGLFYPNTKYDDLYKLSLSLMLENNEYIGALLPASFLQAGVFHERLETVIFINRPLFKHTESPVCLALFGKKNIDDIFLYSDDEYIGIYHTLQENLPKSTNINLDFNIPSGNLGLVAIDNNKEPSIRFCHGHELSNHTISQSSRSITRIDGVHTCERLIKELNTTISKLRISTNDIFLTTFKGLRRDGKYRRRIEYRLARNIIGACL